MTSGPRPRHSRHRPPRRGRRATGTAIGSTVRSSRVSAVPRRWLGEGGDGCGERGHQSIAAPGSSGRSRWRSCHRRESARTHGSRHRHVAATPAPQRSRRPVAKHGTRARAARRAPHLRPKRSRHARHDTQGPNATGQAASRDSATGDELGQELSLCTKPSPSAIGQRPACPGSRARTCAAVSELASCGRRDASRSRVRRALRLIGREHQHARPPTSRVDRKRAIHP